MVGWWLSVGMLSSFAFREAHETSGQTMYFMCKKPLACVLGLRLTRTQDELVALYSASSQGLWFSYEVWKIPCPTAEPATKISKFLVSLDEGWKILQLWIFNLIFNTNSKCKICHPVCIRELREFFFTSQNTQISGFWSYILVLCPDWAICSLYRHSQSHPQQIWNKLSVIQCSFLSLLS